ncbi:hypothetical protein ACFL6C_05025 [Myxococcota bacterium]
MILTEEEDLKREFRERAEEHMKGPNPHKPTHTIYVVRDWGEDAKPAWDSQSGLAIQSVIPLRTEIDPLDHHTSTGSSRRERSI